MGKKKKKSSAAENLIDSLMDDLKGLQSENSNFGKTPNENFEGLPLIDDAENRLDRTSATHSIWGNLKNAVDNKVPETNSFDHIELESDFANSASINLKDSSLAIPDLPLELPLELPDAEPFSDLPSVKKGYDGPSLNGVYQSAEDLKVTPVAKSFSLDDDATHPIVLNQKYDDGKTLPISSDIQGTATFARMETESTVAVEGFANARVGRKSAQDIEKVTIGSHRVHRGSAGVLTSIDASLVQAENLKIAQQRILELEREVEKWRSENDEIASAAEIIRSRSDEMFVRMSALEKEMNEIQESSQNEMLILRGNLKYKENELVKSQIKVEELEIRLKADFKKIRVRERELENRLELLKVEKAALMRSKDDYILEQKRKADQLSQELNNYRRKCLELNKTIEANQEQVKRTERALRLALTNLEVKEDNKIPTKKAE